MKMEDAKALFFAQYWGQPVLRFPVVDDRSPQAIGAEVDFSTLPSWALYKEYNYWSVQHGYLLLRTVDQLTDEEIEILYNLIGAEKKEYPLPEIIRLVTNGAAFFLTNVVYQYLLRIGILLKFTYIDETGNPVTKSVVEIIELNWAKIKKVA